MSKQQWGHGYNKGYEDGKLSPQKANWVAAFKDGVITNAWRIAEVTNEGLCICEHWNYLDWEMLVTFNRRPKSSLKKEEIAIEDYCEINFDTDEELSNCEIKWYQSWQPIIVALNEMAKAHKDR